MMKSDVEEGLETDYRKESGLDIITCDGADHYD